MTEASIMKAAPPKHAIDARPEDHRPEDHDDGALDTPITGLNVSVYTIPTEEPESDATLEWEHTTMVLVEACAADRIGIGYTYAHEAAAVLVRDLLTPLVVGSRLRDHRRLWERMKASVRNLGIGGLAATAISAVDNSLWDLRGQVLKMPLTRFLGSVRARIPVYGSGGFTSYDEETLIAQLKDWAESGLSAVKMKVGREPEKDLARVRAARRAIGMETELFVDGNNGYTLRPAVEAAREMVEDANITWFEQPLPDEDVTGMRRFREQTPASLETADGEYGYTKGWFERRLEANAVDVYMPDVTRCLGLTGFLDIARLCQDAGAPLSSHCAPSLHATLGCVVPSLRHCEYFHDHARIEQAVFEGAPFPDKDGNIRPDPERPGFGLEFKPADASRLAMRDP